MNKKTIEAIKILNELLGFAEIYNIKDKNLIFTMLKEEITKLKNNEFSVAVVGTMSAGKSTFINSIVGKEILPHRNEGMTIIPTKIIHSIMSPEKKTK